MLTTPLLFFFFLTNTPLKYSRDTKRKNTFIVLARVLEDFFVVFYSSEEVGQKSRFQDFPVKSPNREIINLCSLMNLYLKFPVGNGSRITICLINYTLECARSNPCCVNKTFNGYGEWLGWQTYKYVFGCIMVIIIKCCQESGEIEPVLV